MTTAKNKRPRAAAASAAPAPGKRDAVKGKDAAVARAAADDISDGDAKASQESSDLTSSSSDAYSSDTSGESGEDDSTSSSDDGSNSGEEDEGEEGDGAAGIGGSGKTAAGDTKKAKKKKEIIVDFEFYDPKPVDFHGLKALLNTWLDGAEYDASGLCDALISQNTVGTVLKTEEGGDPIGVISCLDARRAQRDEKEGDDDGRHVRALEQLKEYLVSCAPTPDDASRVEAAFAAGTGSTGGDHRRHTGVVVSERLLNVPPALASPLHEALFDEIEWATEDEPTPELRKSFEFGRYLVFSRVWLDDEGGDGEDDDGGGGGKDDDDGGSGEVGETRKKARRLPSTPAPPPSSSRPVVVFARPEDQFLSEAAEWSYVFEPPKPMEPSRREERPHRRGELRRARLVACVDAGAIRGVREKIKRALALDAGAGGV